MNISQLAVQLYTLRDFCQTEEALASTLQRVRSIGYEAVQVSGIGPIEPARVAELCATAGLTICASHENSTLLREDPDAAADRLRAMGITLTAYPYPAGVDFADPASVRSLLTDLERAGRIFREQGLTLAYHNHAIEFLRVDGRTIMDLIFDEVPGADLQFELDTYWVQAGGACPVEWCRKTAGRLPIIHLKDYMMTADNKPAFASIGSGNLNFPAIVQAAEEGGCQWFVVEQDVCPGDPFDAITESFVYCRDHLCS
jgi:sugar phosphate isomerase/epimerase